MKTFAYALVAALALGATQTAVAAERAKPSQPTAQTLKVQPYGAKPDLVIANTLKVGPDEFKVYIKNQGNAHCPQTGMKVTNASSGGTGILQIPALPAGNGEWVLAKIWPNVKDGDRFLLVADHNNAVAEIKENNNKYAFNW